MDFLHRKAIAVALSRALRGVVARPLEAEDVALNGASVCVSTLTFLPLRAPDGAATASVSLLGVEINLGGASVVVDKLTVRVRVRATGGDTPAAADVGADAAADSEPATGAGAATPGIDGLAGAAAAVVSQLLSAVTDESCLRLRHVEVIVEPASLLPPDDTASARQLPAVRGLLLELHGATVSLAAGIAPRQPHQPAPDDGAAGAPEERLDAAAGVRCAVERLALRLLFDDTDGASPPLLPLLELLPPVVDDPALSAAGAAPAVRVEAAFDAAAPLQLGAGPPLLAQPISVELARAQAHVSPRAVLACARLAAAVMDAGRPSLLAASGLGSGTMAASGYSVATRVRRRRDLGPRLPAMEASSLSLQQQHQWQSGSMAASLLDPSVGQLPRAVPGVVDATLRSVAAYFATTAASHAGSAGATSSLSASVLTTGTAVAVSDGGGYGGDDGSSFDDDGEGDDAGADVVGDGGFSSLWNLLPLHLQALSAGLLRARRTAGIGGAATSAAPDDTSDVDTESGGSRSGDSDGDGSSGDLHRQVASLTESCYVSALPGGGDEGGRRGRRHDDNASALPRPLSVSLACESLLVDVYGDSWRPAAPPAPLPQPPLLSLSLHQADCHLVPGVLATGWLLRAEARHGVDAAASPAPALAMPLLAVSDVTARLMSGDSATAGAAPAAVLSREVRARSVALTATAAQAAALAQQAGVWLAVAGEATALLSPPVSASPPAAAPPAGGSSQPAPLRLLVDRLDAALVTRWQDATTTTASVVVQGVYATIGAGAGDVADGAAAAVSVAVPHFAAGVTDSLRVVLTCSQAAAAAASARVRAPAPAPLELRVLDVRPAAAPIPPTALPREDPPHADVCVHVGEVALLLDGRRVRALTDTLQAAAADVGSASPLSALPSQATVPNAGAGDRVASVSVAVHSVAVLCFLPDGLEPVLAVSGMRVSRTVADTGALGHVRMAASVRDVTLEATQHQHSVTLLSCSALASGTPPAPALQSDVLLPAAASSAFPGSTNNRIIRADVTLSWLRLDDPVLLALVGIGCADVWLRSTGGLRASAAPVVPAAASAMTAPPATAVRLRLRLPEVDVLYHRGAAALPPAPVGRDAAAHAAAAAASPLAASAHLSLRALSVLAELRPQAVSMGVSDDGGGVATGVHVFAEVGEVAGSVRAPPSQPTSATAAFLSASTRRARRASPSRVDDALMVSIRGLQAGVHDRPWAHTSQQHVLLQQVAVTAAAGQLPLLASALVHCRHDAARLAAAYGASALAVTRSTSPPATAAVPVPAVAAQRRAEPAAPVSATAQPLAPAPPARHVIAHRASSDDSEDFVSEPVVPVAAPRASQPPPQPAPTVMRGGVWSSARAGGGRWTSRRGSGSGGGSRLPGPSVRFMDEAIVIDDAPLRPRQTHRTYAPQPPSAPPPVAGATGNVTAGGEWAQLQSRSTQLQAAVEGAAASSGCHSHGDGVGSAGPVTTAHTSSAVTVVEASLTLTLPSSGALSLHATCAIAELTSSSGVSVVGAAATTPERSAHAAAASTSCCYSLGAVTLLERLPAAVGQRTAPADPPHALLTVAPSDERAAWHGVAPALLLQVASSHDVESASDAAAAGGLLRTVDVHCGPVTVDVRGRLISAVDVLAALPTTRQAAAIAAAPASHAGVRSQLSSPSLQQHPAAAHFVSVAPLQLTFSFDPEGHGVRLELAQDGVGLAIDDGGGDDAVVGVSTATPPRRHTILHAPRASRLLQSLFHARIGASVACVRLVGVPLALPAARVGPAADGASAGRALADVYSCHLSDVALPTLALSLPRAVLTPLVALVWGAGSQAARAAAAHVGGTLWWRSGDDDTGQRLEDAYAHTAAADGADAGGDGSGASAAAAAARAKHLVYSMPREAAAVVRQVARAVAEGLAGALQGVLRALLGSGSGGDGHSGSPSVTYNGAPPAAAVRPPSPDVTDSWVHI